MGSTLPVTGYGSRCPGGRGFANSITNTADGWVTPAEIARLRAPGTPPSAQLLFRFTSAGSYAQVRADVAEVARTLPAGTVTAQAPGSPRRTRRPQRAIMEPFVVAFALIGLVMAVLIVGNVVSGRWSPGTPDRRAEEPRPDPAQVVVVYLGRVGWPALAGCLAGVVAAICWRPGAAPVGRGLRVGRQQVPWWASIAARSG